MSYYVATNFNVMMLFIRLMLIVVVVNNVCDTSHVMDRTSGSTNAFDCLETWDLYDSYLELSTFPDNKFIASYCRRLTTKVVPNLSFLKNKTTINGQAFTFHQLRELNISAEQLLKWYAPMDIIEEYESQQETGLFFNCSHNESFWFGTHCQYTFDSDGDIASIIEQRMNEQEKVPNNLLSITNGTCYIVDDNQCSSVICLDWREICDGKYRHLVFDTLYCFGTYCDGSFSLFSKRLPVSFLLAILHSENHPGKEERFVHIIRVEHSGI